MKLQREKGGESVCMCVCERDRDIYASFYRTETLYLQEFWSL